MFDKINIPEEYKLKLDKIFSLQKEGLKENDISKLNKATERLQELSMVFPNMPMSYYLLATIYIYLEKKNDAIYMFKKTIELAKDSEDVSWLFFNFLWSKKMFDEALSEARRYFKRNHHKPNKKYMKILAEINLDYDKIIRMNDSNSNL